MDMVIGAAELTADRFVGSRVRWAGANQSIAGSTLTKVTYDTVMFDTHKFWDPTNNTRLTAPVDGYYLIGGVVEWNTSASLTTERAADLFVNNTTIAMELGEGFAGANGSSTPALGNNGLYKFAAGDYMELRVYQASGGALTLFTEAWGPSMWMALLGT